MNEIWHFQEGLPALPRVASRIAKDLQQGPSPFVLWLCGPLGAGKTALVREVLYQLGLERAIPVLSPTFTLMTDYAICAKWYAHLDLYRVKGRFSEEWAGIENKVYSGYFVEWPATEAENFFLQATHRLVIDFCGEATRSYRFFSEHSKD